MKVAVICNCAKCTNVARKKAIACTPASHRYITAFGLILSCQPNCKRRKEIVQARPQPHVWVTKHHDILQAADAPNCEVNGKLPRVTEYFTPSMGKGTDTEKAVIACLNHVDLKSLLTCSNACLQSSHFLWESQRVRHVSAPFGLRRKNIDISSFNLCSPIRVTQRRHYGRGESVLLSVHLSRKIAAMIAISDFAASFICMLSIL